jgi:hypothetical protein
LAAPPIARYERRYRALARRLSDIGSIGEGSLVRRATSCGKPTCRCQADPPRLHGPYWQWTRKVASRTQGRRLTDAEADLYREWIANARRLEAIVAEMREVSHQAGDLLLTQARESQPPR